METGIDPKVDYAFKRVFGSEENREILLNLLNAVLMSADSRPLQEIEILNPFSHKVRSMTGSRFWTSRRSTIRAVNF